MIQSRRALCFAAVTVVAVASGCGGTGAPSPVTRNEVGNAFSGINQPLAVLRDVQTIEPESTLDIVYIPASNIVSPSFQVELFEDEDAAIARAQTLRKTRQAGRGFYRYKNAVLTFAASISDAERQKLIATLKST